VVVERNAFSRAKAYLDYSSRAKWLAVAGGIGTGIFYVFLVLILALLVDLLVTRGRVPNLAQLSVPEQEQFLDNWKKLPNDARVEAIRHIGYGEFEANATGPARAADRARFESFRALTSTENLPPLPGKMNTEDLKKWSQLRGPIEDPPYVQAMKEQELRWRAYVWLYLREHVTAEAADSYQPKVQPTEALPVPGLGEENRQPHGLLSLVVRLRGSFGGRLLNGVASFNPWMWESSDGRDPNRRLLTGLLLLAILGALLRTGCMMLMNLQAARATIEAVTRLRRAIYHHSSRLGDLALRANGTGEAHGLFTRHIEAVHEALYLWLTTAFRYPAQVILLSALALFVQPWLALAVVLFALLVWLMGGQIVAAFRRQARASSKQAASRLVLLLESLRLMRLVKSYLMELFNQSRVERQLTEYARAHQLRYRGEALARPVLVLLATLAGITLLYLAGRIVLSDGLSLAGLTILVVAVAGLYPPVRGWFDLKKHLRRGRESAAALFNFLDRKGDQKEFADAEFLQPMAKALEFKEIAVKDPGSNRILLSDVNLTIAAGEKIGIMGGDETEKQALLYLIPRFYDPSDGEVRVDGRNIRWVTMESLRAQIGMVMLNGLIFNDTVANNIGCGEPGYTLPQIIEAAKIAHAHQFIQKLPYGYETQIGEMGHSLRVGEQFRIALARAILRDPAIWIIEEPHGFLDDDTKALLDDTLSRILPEKTAIFLPHRISTLRMCDKIVLVHNGTIEAVGEHRDLVHSSSLYKHLYYLEFNAFADQT
jgi:ATP-binding cassette subfamily B protein